MMRLARALLLAVAATATRRREDREADERLAMAAYRFEVWARRDEASRVMTTHPSGAGFAEWAAAQYGPGSDLHVALMACLTGHTDVPRANSDDDGRCRMCGSYGYCYFPDRCGR